MDKEFVRSYLLSNGKYFPERKLHEISSDMELSNVNEYVVNLNFRNPTLFTILYWFVPLFWWLDRFFVRDFFGGIVKAILYPSLVLLSGIIGAEYKLNKIYANAVMVLGVIWFVWVLIDGFTIYGRVKGYNYRKLKTKLGNRITATKIGFAPTLLLISSIVVFSWGMTIRNEAKNNIPPLGEIEETNELIKNETVEEPYYEHSCGESEIEPEYIEEQTANIQPNTSEIVDPFKNYDDYRGDDFGGNGVGNDSGTGTAGYYRENIKERKTVFEPSYDDVELFEKCKIEYRLIVDEKGTVRNAYLQKYSPLANGSFYSWKENRQRKKQEANLIDICDTRMKKIRFEATNEMVKPTKDFLYVIEFGVNPLNSSVSYRPLSR